MIKHVYVSSCTVPILIKLEFSRLFEKYSNIKFHENPSIGSQVIPGRTDGRMDGQDEANSRFSQFCLRA
jgi:hypothetical protein